MSNYFFNMHVFWDGKRNPCKQKELMQALMRKALVNPGGIQTQDLLLLRPQEKVWMFDWIAFNRSFGT